MRLATLVLVCAMCLGVGGAGAVTSMRPQEEVMPNGPVELRSQSAADRQHVSVAGVRLRHSARYLTVVKLKRGIQRFCTQGAGACALKGQWWRIEDVGWRAHLSPAFIVAASMTESSGGDASCYGNPYNIWGLSSCGPGWYVPTFQSWRQAFTFFAVFVHRRWPHARTAYDLPGYSACWSCWGSRTALWMARMGFGPSLRYP